MTSYTDFTYFHQMRVPDVPDISFLITCFKMVKILC